MGLKAKKASVPAGPRLRVAQIWRGEVMDERIFAEPAAVKLGASKRCAFVVPELGLPAEFTMFRPTARGYVLTLGHGMEGKLHLGGKAQSVAELLLSGATDRAEGAAGNFRAFPIVEKDWGIVHLDGEGDHTIFFQFTGPIDDAERLPASHLRDTELLQPSFAFSLVMHGILLALTYVFLDYNAQGIVFPGNSDALTGYLVRRPDPLPVPEKAPAAAAKAGMEDGEKAAAPASSSGDEGKSGGEGKKPRARDPNPGDPAPKTDVVRAVQNRGILKHRDKLAALGGIALDDRLGLAASRLKGPMTAGGAGFGSGKGTGVGSGIGTGTLTRSNGKGSGGGGTAHADVVTTGKIETGGSRAARGVAGGTGLKEVGVAVSLGNGDGDFSGLSKEEVQKVVAARQSAIRYCFEKELQRSPNIDGKIIVNWRIESSGVVSSSKVKTSTLNNAAVEDCIVRQVRKWKFPTSAGTSNVNFPFIFSKH